MPAAAAAATIDTLPAIVADLERRLADKEPGVFGPLVFVSAHRDRWRVMIWGYAKREFDAPTLAGALAATDAWLARDDLAEQYATIGLTADGRLAEAA